MDFDLAEVKNYLENRFQKEVEIEEVKQLAGKATASEALKQFGYGRPFRQLHNAFWANYVTLRLDEELQSVIQPWFSWRALVLANPIWYPDISEDVRRKLLRFARKVLSAKRYNYRKVNQYIGRS
jgi:hypothetical protein